MLTKYASLEASEILDIKGSPSQARTASLERLADFDDFRTKDNYLYARIRAISSRTNKNFDGWPSIELAGGPEVFDHHHSSEGGFTVEADTGAEYGYSTFLGKPIFVDHHNSDPKRARGVIVDAKLHVEDREKTAKLDPYYADAPEGHNPPTWVELLLEVDAKSFPKLAKAIISGSKDPHKGIDGFSMGADVEKSVCNICKNSATEPSEYCEHVRMKGAHFDHISDDGTKTSKQSFEDCYGVKFFEISAVFDPADETALLKEVRSSVSKEASTHTADNPLPQSDLTHAPEDIDTLRDEQICPICGSQMDSETCDICGYTEPPDHMNNPDLDQAQETDLRQEELGQDVPYEVQPKEGQPEETALGKTPNPKNPSAIAHVTSDVSKWQISLHPKVTGKINTGERPIAPGNKRVTDEPKEEVVKDHDKPVTSTMRTAKQLIDATRRTKENNMSNRRVAAEPLADAKADKRVDVEGVGGFIQDSNEEASKPEGPHSWENKGVTVDVEGKGAVLEGTNEEASQPSAGTEDVAKEVRTDDSGPTKTFDNSNEPGSAVTQQAFSSDRQATSHKCPKCGADCENERCTNCGANTSEAREAAKQGVKPNGPADVQPSKRVDVESDEYWHTQGTPTDQWTGTDGNGVTRQQNPVTSPSIATDGFKSSHLFAAFKLADLEVGMGLLPAEKKYERAAELEAESPETVIASLKYAQKVKTAGLSSQTRTAKRMPSLSQPTAVRESSVQEDSEVDDSALFS